MYEVVGQLRARASASKRCTKAQSSCLVVRYALRLHPTSQRHRYGVSAWHQTDLTSFSIPPMQEDGNRFQPKKYGKGQGGFNGWGYVHMISCFLGSTKQSQGRPQFVGW